MVTHQPGRAMEAGCTALVVLGPLSGLMFPFLAAWGWSPYGWPGAWILALGYGAAWPVVAIILCKQRPVEEPSSQRSQTAGLLIGLGIAVALAALLRPHAPLVATVLNTLFFVGLGEELFFRGYVQSRLNEAFGRPYQLWSARFGPGMILAALLFGLTHVLNPAPAVKRGPRGEGSIPPWAPATSPGDSPRLNAATATPDGAPGWSFVAASSAVVVTMSRLCSIIGGIRQEPDSRADHAVPLVTPAPGMGP
ncbi:MAG: hypothetical protein DIU69_11460 [Bacillota bacterium]|nr:MAG: hypothetical protein DIU69_11460 [Bacillota bacterium]